jgi:formylmethanofuran dehydrogenase subunit D
MSQLIKTLAAALLTALLATGCSPWSQYYTDTSNGVTSAYSGSTQLIYSADGRELQDYYAKGYTTVGISSFWKNGNVTSDDLQSLGESKGADIVVYWRSGEHTKTYLYAQTHTHQQPGQTYITGSSYGNQFSGTATTYGGSSSSTTTVTPVSVPSANYEAHFLRKAR